MTEEQKEYNIYWNQVLMDTFEGFDEEDALENFKQHMSKNLEAINVQEDDNNG